MFLFFLGGGAAPSKGNRCHRCVDHARFQLHCRRHVPWSPPWHPGSWRSPRLPPLPKRGPNWKTLGISWHPQCPRTPTKPYVEPCWSNEDVICQESFSQMLRNPKHTTYMFILSMCLCFCLMQGKRNMKGSTASRTSYDFGFPAGQRLVTVAFNPTARRPAWNIVRKSTRLPYCITVSILSVNDITVLLLKNILKLSVIALVLLCAQKPVEPC